MAAKRKKARALTVKERKLTKGIAEGKTKQQAAMEAYDAATPETASAIASETLKNLRCKMRWLRHLPGTALRSTRRPNPSLMA